MGRSTSRLRAAATSSSDIRWVMPFSYSRFRVRRAGRRRRALAHPSLRLVNRTSALDHAHTSDDDCSRTRGSCRAWRRGRNRVHGCSPGHARALATRSSARLHTSPAHAWGSAAGTIGRRILDAAFSCGEADIRGRFFGWRRRRLGTCAARASVSVYPVRVLIPIG